jgi:hypothetical protein
MTRITIALVPLTRVGLTYCHGPSTTQAFLRQGKPALVLRNEKGRAQENAGCSGRDDRKGRAAQGLAAIRGREWVAGGQDVTVGAAKSFLQWLKPGRRGVAYVGPKGPPPLTGEEGRVAAGRDSAAEGSGDIGDGSGENSGIRDFLQALKRIIAAELMSELKLRPP